MAEGCAAGHLYLRADDSSSSSSRHGGINPDAAAPALPLRITQADQDAGRCWRGLDLGRSAESRDKVCPRVPRRINQGHAGDDEG